MTEPIRRRLMSDDPSFMAVREAFLRQRALDDMREGRRRAAGSPSASDRLRDWLAIHLGSWALALGSRSFKSELREVLSNGVRVKDEADRVPGPTIDPEWRSKSAGASPIGFVCSQSDVEGY